MAENTERAAQRSGGEENRSAEPVVLCGANSYQQKYYFNKEFKRLPESIQQELQIMCVLFTEDIGGVLMLMLGLIGEYIGRMYICMNSAPQFVIREIVGGTEGGEKNGKQE